MLRIMPMSGTQCVFNIFFWMKTTGIGIYSHSFNQSTTKYLESLLKPGVTLGWGMKQWLDRTWVCPQETYILVVKYAFETIVIGFIRGLNKLSTFWWMLFGCAIW